MITLLGLLVIVQVSVGSGYAVAEYDVGCYAEFKRYLSSWGHLAFQYAITPYCVQGGLYRHVQCRKSSPRAALRCYCAFVDNGAENTDVSVDRIHNTLQEMFSLCPVTTQHSSGQCTTPPVTYPCTVDQKKYRFVPSQKKCEEVSFGCFGYATMQECTDACAPIVYNECSFPINMGYPCSQAAGTRFRHNPSTGQCERFDYRGCGGNSNAYKNMWECEQSCVPQNKVSFLVQVDLTKLYNVTAYSWVLDKYNMEADGVNMAIQPIFNDIKEDAISTDLISDSTQDETDSRSFNTGGGSAGQHAVNLNEPNREGIHRVQVCTQESETGPCRAYIPRWFYNATTLTCEEFIYGGCLPNYNNFESPQECTSFCHPDYQPAAVERTGSSGTNQDNSDPYLEDGTEVVWRFQGLSTNTVVQPRTVLLSDGPSGDGTQNT